MAVRVDVQGIVGTRLQTRLAADTAVGVEIDHAVVPAIKRSNGTDGDAGRPIAVVAAHHREVAPIGGEGPFLDILHPGPIDADGHLMLTFAGHRTGMAADALAVPEQRNEVGPLRHPVRAGERVSRLLELPRTATN